MKKIIVVDYGMGNIHSLSSAIRKLGYLPEISSSKKEILNASHLILPGVGEFQKAMKNLTNLSLDQLIKDCALKKKVNVLGICLGMQIMCNSSLEGDSKNKGLGIINGDVIKLEQKGDYKLPHIGFNEVIFHEGSLYKNNNKVVKDFYFVHSYCLMDCAMESNAILGLTEYKNKFVSYFQRGNIYATQFHPEKSQTNGLELLKLFLQL